MIRHTWLPITLEYNRFVIIFDAFVVSDRKTMLCEDRLGVSFDGKNDCNTELSVTDQHGRIRSFAVKNGVRHRLLRYRTEYFILSSNAGYRR